MLLNPELVETLRLAHERGIVLAARNGVNLNTATGEGLEALVRYRFRSLVISIDGASAETYRIYRVNGDFERVIANVRPGALARPGDRSTRAASRSPGFGDSL